MTDRAIPSPAAPDAQPALAQRAATTPRPAPARKPRMLATAIASLACFLVAFEFLAFQLTSGKDPALGSTPVAAVAPKRPVVVDRRLIQTRVVHLPPKSTTVAPANGSGAASATPVAAPASAAPPAPAPPAPAPAPAPAPTVTSSS